jgi:hypothetical protein
MNQLIPNVSSVPKVRQLTALRTDRACVSAPRNKTTGQASLGIIDATAYHGGIGPVRHAPHAKSLDRRWTAGAITCILRKEITQTL